MKGQEALFSSAKDDWRTPKALYARLCAGRFDVSDRHGGTFDALTDEWPEPWFCNPPYGRQIGEWTRCMKRNGVALLPVRTDTEWFHELWPRIRKIVFFKGRLHFNDNGPAPFPSMVVYV